MVFRCLVTLLGVYGCGSDPALLTPAPDDDRQPDAMVDEPVVPPVTELSASFDADAVTVTLSWRNPAADLDGVLIARRTGAEVSGQPAKGNRYAVGDELPGGGRVVFVGGGERFVDRDLAFGTANYAVWSFDESQRYSVPTRVAVAVTEPPQLGTLTIRGLATTPATPALTVSRQPSLVSLSGNPTYDGDTDRLRITLQLTSRFPRLMFHPKVVVDALAQGSVDTAEPQAGTLDGKPYLYLGPLAWTAGGIRSVDLVVDGIDGSLDAITIDLSIVNHPSIIASAGWGNGVTFVDSSGSGRSATVAIPFAAPATAPDPQALLLDGATSPDGRYVYLGNYNLPSITTIDTTTLTATTGPNLSSTANPVGAVDSVALSPDGNFLYAVLVDGDLNEPPCFPSNPSCPAPPPVQVELLRLERANPSNITRLSLLQDNAQQARGRRLSMSADGVIGIVPVQNAGLAFVVQLPDMRLVDTDPNSPGVQPVDLSNNFSDAPRYATLSADGLTAYLAFHNGFNLPAQNDGTLARLDMRGFATESLSPGTLSQAGNYVADLQFGPDRRLYLARSIPGSDNPNRAALTIFDLEASTQVPFFLGGDLNALAFHPDGLSAYVIDATYQIRRIDLPNDSVAPGPLPATGLGYGPTLLLTPF